MIVFTIESIDIICSILKKTGDIDSSSIFFDDSKTLRKVTNFDVVEEFFEVNGMSESHIMKYKIILIDGVEISAVVHGDTMLIDTFDLECKKDSIDYGINKIASGYMF